MFAKFICFHFPSVVRALIGVQARWYGCLPKTAQRIGFANWRVEGRSVMGASGLLDRVDALCFAALVFVCSAQWKFRL